MLECEAVIDKRRTRMPVETINQFPAQSETNGDFTTKRRATERMGEQLNG